ncbi:PREDICTED: coatomer subunit zeta-1-like, partial [Priapulus caudatus]|uniref:Coatomer subunit zeta n=1 Tax=Priapulus caudatus TaxID=37621 RepID=A0ABM1EV50_PRICU
PLCKTIIFQDITLYTVKAILILDNDGNRLLVKYYGDTFPTAKEQNRFEKDLFNKMHKSNAEVILLDGLTCLYRASVDLNFCVIGNARENELLLLSVLNTLFESVSQILRKEVEKRTFLEHYDSILLAVDEICDAGVVIQSDPAEVVLRAGVRGDELSLGEQTMAQVIQSARDQLKWSLLK